MAWIKACFHFSIVDEKRLVTLGTKVNFLLAFGPGSCHKRSTVRREAHRPQVQEGHSIGSFGVREAQPQFRIDFELPQRDIFSAWVARAVSGLR